MEYMDRKAIKIRRVKQRHAMSCGPACIAMVTGLSYDKVLDFMHPPGRRTKKGNKLNLATDSAKMLKSLRKLGFKAKASTRTSTKRLRHLTIINIRWAGKEDVSSEGVFRRHWVVWDPWQKRFLDPYYKTLSNAIYEKAFKRGSRIVITVERDE